MVFCLLYEVTGSLWPSIALHTFNNAVAFLVQTTDGRLAVLGDGLGLGAYIRAIVPS